MKKDNDQTVAEKFDVVTVISGKIGELCKAIEGAREQASRTGISLGYEVRYDSVGTLVDFKAWIKEGDK